MRGALTLNSLAVWKSDVFTSQIKKTDTKTSTVEKNGKMSGRKSKITGIDNYIHNSMINYCEV